MNTYALQTKDLQLAIGGTPILRGVSLELLQGSTVGLIGPNGSGKTTLFNCLSGFLLPQSGEISLDGQVITALPPHQRSKLGLGRVFQNFGVFRQMTLEENILVALDARASFLQSILPRGLNSRKQRDRAREFLDLVGLADRARAKASSLSGGQMRLLELVRLLACDSKVFLLDEPTAGVSPKLKERVIEFIVSLQEQGRTVLIIEHDIEFIESFCSRILAMDTGRIVLDGEPRNVRESDTLQEIYFGGGR